MLESKALLENLKVTAVDEVTYSSRYLALTEAVKDYRGIHKAAEHLLVELHHPFRNWGVVIPELRSFALKNFSIYSVSSHGRQAFDVLVDTFLDIMEIAPKEEHKALALEGLMALLEKAVASSEPETLKAFAPTIENAFSKLTAAPDSIITSVAIGYHSVPNLAEKLATLLEKYEMPASFWNATGRLLLRIQEITFKTWLRFEDPVSWLDRVLSQHDLHLSGQDAIRVRKLLEPVSRDRIKAWLEKTSFHGSNPFTRESVLELSRRPEHQELVCHYRDIAKEMEQIVRPDVSNKSGENHLCQDGALSLHLLFLFHMVEMEGLAILHEESLRQINRNLLRLVRIADFERLKKILPRNFALLKQQVGHFPRTAFQCINALGNEVFRKDDTRLIELFLKEVVAFGFQPPSVTGVDSEWQVLRNPAHLENIRLWLRLICQKPKVCRTLLSALIINLNLAGTCIRDTDLFQKDVSRFMNCDIEPVYNLVKQLVRSLPVYFNEIGAEGLLRDVSTELDEISRRKDILIHFLRKQSHVESNNLIVDFIRAILCFWYSRQKGGLASFIPPEIYEQVVSHGPHVEHVHRLVRHLAEVLELEPFATHIGRIIRIPEERLSSLLSEVPDIPPQEKRRVELLIQMYRLVTMKYELGTEEIRDHLKEARNWGFTGLERVIEAIDRNVPEECLEAILEQLETLKDIVTSRDKFEILEDIYHKRHIAADIPSMYGRYHERKFDALSLTFRLENLANLYFERLMAAVEVPFITNAIFGRILRCLRLFWKAIQLNGLHSKKFDTYLTLLEKSLEMRGFKSSQYLDIVHGLSDGVKDIIDVYYISIHQDNVPLIIQQLGKENLLPKFHATILESENDTQLIDRISERFLRDMIAGTFGLQYLDNFISRIYQLLAEQKEVLSSEKLDLLLSYDPCKVLCSIHQPNKATRNLIHLGNKGYNLVLLAEEGLPVPPGIIVTTEVFRCYPVFQRFERVYRDFKWQLEAGIRTIERAMGRTFGDPSNPLLLSVRSGATISMPGMMATIINVGSTLETTEGLAKRTGKEWFAWDNYRRFLQSWAMAFGLNREVFTALMRLQKHKYGVDKKRDFSGKQMKELALSYRQAILDHGLELAEDPFEQLLMALRLVLGSWQSEKSKAYRKIMEISDFWGTAVIIQAMAFGNLSESSGTGVVFTANPSGRLGQVSLWGDYTSGNQGEDVVSGLVSTYPISSEQRDALGYAPGTSLEETFPDIYHALLDCAKKLIYEKRWTPQEIEFTFEGPAKDQLFILQSRDMTTKKRATIEVFAPSPSLDACYVARGVGASGGVLSGKAVFTLSEIESMRKREPDTPLILIRSDTVPDDIKETSLANGLLTAKGGQTSHAAIVASRLDKICVVGCQHLQVFETRGFAKINDHVIQSGDYVSIDGRNGSVYMGRQPIQKEEKFL